MSTQYQFDLPVGGTLKLNDCTLRHIGNGRFETLGGEMPPYYVETITFSPDESLARDNIPLAKVDKCDNENYYRGAARLGDPR